MPLSPSASASPRRAAASAVRMLSPSFGYAWIPRTGDCVLPSCMPSTAPTIVPLRDRGNIDDIVWQELGDAAWVMAAIVDIGVEPDDATKPLRRALEHRLQQVRERCLLLLGFTGDAVTLRRAGEQLDSDEAEQRASPSRCWTRRSPGTPAAPDDSVRGSSRGRCLAADVDDVSAAAAGTLSASVPADHTRWAPFRAMDPSLRHTLHAVVGRGRSGARSGAVAD